MKDTVPTVTTSGTPKKKIFKPSDAAVPNTVNVKTVHERLKGLILTKPFPFRNTAHTHIKCNVPNCAFCKDLFKQVNLTKCEGHKPCSNTGFYPHVGSALWAMVKSKHAKGVPCKLKSKACKQNELPALEQYKPVGLDPVVEMDESSTHSYVSDTPSADNGEGSIRSTSKRQWSGSQWSIQTVHGPLNWADDVEDMYHQLKAKKRGMSEPPNSN